MVIYRIWLFGHILRPLNSDSYTHTQILFSATLEHGKYINEMISSIPMWKNCIKKIDRISMFEAWQKNEWVLVGTCVCTSPYLMERHWLIMSKPLKCQIIATLQQNQNQNPHSNNNTLKHQHIHQSQITHSNSNQKPYGTLFVASI